MKIEIDFIPVEDKLPIDFWKEESWWRDGEEETVFGEVFAIVNTDDPDDDPEICIVAYFPDKGFVYLCDLTTKYDGAPWKVTHWAFKPDIKKEKR